MIVRSLVCAIIVFAASAASAADPVWSIEKLNAAHDNWSQLVGTPLRVEGRVSSHIQGTLRFQKCDLTFRLDAERARKLSGVKNLEVVGRMQRDGNRYVFDVTDFKALPTDREQFQSREAALRTPTANDLYDLGRWAVERGAFYGDEELSDLGKTCTVRGLGLELRDLSAGDYENRFRLADKAAELQAPLTIADNLRHEACREWLAQVVKALPVSADELAKLEARIKALYPSAFQPLKAWPTDLTRDYSLNPSEAYRTADANQRQILHRLLGADVQWARIQLVAKPDGSNGEEIADRIDREIPERHAIAEQYRERALTFRLHGIEGAPRAAAVELATAFRARKRPDLATETLTKWLVAKERRLRPDEAPQFIELADDYLSLVRDERKAVALLTEAHRREPQSADVAARFEQLGYQHDGVGWKKAAPVASGPKPDAPIVPATIPTQLEIGMTVAQLDLLLGRPTATTVMKSATGLDEVRVYGRAGEGSRIIVQLRRSPGQPQLVVTRFDSR